METERKIEELIELTKETNEILRKIYQQLQLVRIQGSPKNCFSGGIGGSFFNIMNDTK